MAQRKLDLEPVEEDRKLDLEPIDEPVSVKEEVPVVKPEPEKSKLSKAWSAISEPLTDAPSRFAEQVSEKYFPMPGAESDDSYLSGLKARATGFYGGAIKGIGDLVSGLSSPINIATAIASAGQGTALKTGLPAIAKLLRGVELGSGALMGAHGASEVVRPDATLMERGMGLTEMAGGGAAMFHTPSKLSNIADSVKKGTVPEIISETGPEIIPEGPITPRAVERGKRINAALEPSQELAVREPNLWLGETAGDVLTPELVSEGAPPLPKDFSDLDPVSRAFAEDTARMEAERISRNADPIQQAADKTRMDEWNQIQDNIRNAKPMSESVEQFANQVIPDENILAQPEQPLDWRTDPIRRERAGELPISESMDVSPTSQADITIPSGQSNPQLVNEIRQKGYKYAGQDAEGNMVFKKSEEPVPISKNAIPMVRRIKDVPHEQSGAIREAWNLSRGMMSVDLPFITSAGLRQGLPMIGTKNWIKAWGPSIKSYGSKAFFEGHKTLLESDPLMQRSTRPVLTSAGTPLVKQGRPVMKEMPSIVEQSGVTLTDLGSLTSREEAIKSQLAERVPIWGKVVAASNRSYVAYINDLRLNTFRNFYEAMPDKNNMVALKELGDAVNTFTGRGPLKSKLPFTSREINLEKYASGASEILFAPKLIAARLQMLNPMNYTMTQPQVRKEYIKAIARTAGAWMTMAGIGKMMGADVSLDPNSSDFGKIKLGKLRLDPAGGFQQYLVLTGRLSSGKFTSSTSGNTYELGKGFGASTRGSVIQDFIVNKLHPSAKNFYDAAFASERKPYPVFDRAVQLALPMLTKDFIEIAKEEPELLPFIAPLVSAGMGSQYYEKGDVFNKPAFIPEEYDITLGR